ncbi:MAG: TonB-dependent hemoglobin/transferrin/lactoferrin family receptor [Erythrobacter sp.]
MSNFINRAAMLSTCSTCAILFSAAPAAAEGIATNAEPDKNTITVTATRAPITVADAPATVTVIDAEQIADELATDIRDLVRFEPGVTVRRAPARFGAALGTTGRAGNEDFNIRGIGGNRVLIQVDGIRTPQGFSFGAQSVGRDSSTDIGLVKTIEILRGPASAFYGSDGLAGAVSFTTSDPADLIADDSNFGGFARAQYSSADQEFAETIAVAGRTGQFSAMLAYSRRDFQELDNQGTNDVLGSNRTTPNPQDGESNSLLGKLVWAQGNHRVRLTGEYQEREVFSEVLSGTGPVFFGPFPAWNVDSLTALDTTERKRASVDWTWSADEAGSGILDYAHIAAYWQDGEDRQFADEDRSPLSATPRPDRERINTFDNRVYGAVADFRSSFTSGKIKNTISYGGDISFTRQEGLRDGTEPPFGEVFPSRAFPVTDFTLGGAFIGSAIEFAGGNFTLYPALRYDFYDLDADPDALLPSFTPSSQNGSQISPKIGAVLKLGGEVRLFANYAQGFRAPTPSQVNNFFENLAFGYTSAPNPDLEPETSETFEAGVRYNDDNLDLSLTGFVASYDDFVSQEVVSGTGTPFDPSVFQFINLDAVNVNGVEAKADYQSDSGFRARFAIAYADGDVKSPGQAIALLSTIDPLNAVIGIGYSDPAGTFGGELIGTYNARKEANETDGVCNGTCFRPDEFFILDATAFYRLGDALTLRAGVFNITDKKYSYWNDVRGLTDASTITDAFTQPGRNFSVSVSANF